MGTNEKNMTTGSPGKLIITFAIPLMLGNIFQQFYTMADTMIVGQVVGVEALAAVGAGDWLVWLVFGIMTGITQGFSILVAQFYGAREKENLKCAVAKSYIMTALLSVIVLAVSEGAVIPRSVPGIIYGLNTHAGVPSSQIEWHGHNDFYKAVNNSTTAWLYGASGVNCSLFGIGERTGNTPLEAMVFEYAQLKGTLDGMDTTVITELSEYFEKELGYVQPSRTPFVGKNFNVTRAGIHADGLLKNEEIYNIFDTGKFLNRPPLVAVSNTSGLAGIALWINTYYRLPDDRKVDKNSKLVTMIKQWVDEQYDEGRVTTITDNELVVQITDCCKKLNIVL